MAFERFVGLRYLMAKRQRNVLSVITMISIGGVAVGVMALIVVLSVMGGFEGDLREKIIGTKAHIVVSAEDGYIADYDVLLDEIEAVAGVTGASPFVEAEVMINSPANLQGVILRGIDQERIGRVSNLPQVIVEGSLDYLERPQDLPAASRLSSWREDALILQDDSAELNPKRVDELRAAGARAKLGFTAAEHAEHVQQLLNLGEASGPGADEPAPSQLGGTGQAPNQQEDAGPRGLPRVELSTPAETEADRWLDGPPGEGEQDLDERPANAWIGPKGQTQGRVMKAVPGLDPGSTQRKVGGVIIGLELKTNLAVSLGYELNIMSPTGDVGPAGGLPKSRPYKLVGVFYSGMYEYDTKMAYLSLKDAQTLLNIGPRVNGIEVRIEELEKTAQVKAALESALSAHEGLQIQDWRELNGSLFSALLLEKIAMFVILTSIILVASFNILCLLIMIVIEKGREVAILKAMGAGQWGIMKIFVVQGGVIGVLGTVIGCAAGLALCWVIASWGIQLPADVYYLAHIPVEVRPAEVGLICLAAVGISLLATIPPSILAARLDPVEGLRYE